MKARARALARATLAWLRASRALRLALAAAVIDLVLGRVFSWVSGSRGLLSPGGALHADVAILGAVYLLSRVLARFAVPALVGGAIAAVLLRRLHRGLRARDGAQKVRS